MKQSISISCRVINFSNFRNLVKYLLNKLMMNSSLNHPSSLIPYIKTFQGPAACITNFINRPYPCMPRVPRKFAVCSFDFATGKIFLQQRGRRFIFLPNSASLKHAFGNIKIFIIFSCIISALSENFTPH